MNSPASLKMNSEFTNPPRDLVRVLGQHIKWYSRAEAMDERRFQVQEIAFEHISSQPYRAIPLDDLRHSIVSELPLAVTKGELKEAADALCRQDQRRIFKTGRHEFVWAPDGRVPVPTRVREMIIMRYAGQTLDEIGLTFGVTRERVRQLLHRYGGPSASELDESRSALLRQEQQARARKVEEALTLVLTNYGPCGTDEVAKRTGLPADEVSRHWPKHLAHLRLYQQPAAKTWTDDAMLQAIREAAIYEFPLTTTAYDELRRHGEIAGPSVPSISNRFGGWTNACKKAGVESGGSRPRGYESRWTDTDILQFVRDYLMTAGQPATLNGYEEWRATSRPEAPSGPTVRNRLGGWNHVKRVILAPKASGADSA